MKMKRLILLLLTLCLMTGCADKSGSPQNAEPNSEEVIYLEQMDPEELHSAFESAALKWAAGSDNSKIASISVDDLYVDSILLDDTHNARTARNSYLKLLVTLSEGADTDTVRANDLLDSFIQSINGRDLRARLRSASMELRDYTGKLIGTAGDLAYSADAVPNGRDNSQYASLIAQSEEELQVQTMIYNYCLDLDHTYYSQNESFFGHGNFWLRRFGIEKESGILTAQVVTLVPPLDNVKKEKLEADLQDVAEKISEMLINDAKSLNYIRPGNIEEVKVSLYAGWLGEGRVESHRSYQNQ